MWREDDNRIKPKLQIPPKGGFFMANMRQEFHSRLTDIYSNYYKNRTSDSPESSRASLLKRFRLNTQYSSQNGYLLDIGSGRQALFHQFKAFNIPTDYKMHSLDLADIARNRLLAAKLGAEHVRANASTLPFSTGQFDIVMSNLVLDFLGKDVYREVRRVLKPGGKLMVNLQHPILEEVYNHSAARYEELSYKEREVLNVWSHLLSQNMLFWNRDEIKKTLSVYGLEAQYVGQANEKTFSFPPDSIHVANWWEVDAIAT